MNLTQFDGKMVRARALGADGIPDGEWMPDRSDAPTAVTQIGALTVNYVEALDYTQFIVNGIPVEPLSISPVEFQNHLRVV
jgi:hypothetical protein